MGHRLGVRAAVVAVVGVPVLSGCAQSGGTEAPGASGATKSGKPTVLAAFTVLAAWPGWLAVST